MGPTSVIELGPQRARLSRRAAAPVSWRDVPDGVGAGPDAPAQRAARRHERRWRHAPIILVERRRGRAYQYGSIAVCAALWAQVFWLFRA
jgi:hypothetical protein